MASIYHSNSSNPTLATSDNPPINFCPFALHPEAYRPPRRPPRSLRPWSSNRRRRRHFRLTNQMRESRMTSIRATFHRRPAFPLRRTKTWISHKPRFDETMRLVRFTGRFSKINILTMSLFHRVDESTSDGLTDVR